MNVTLIRIEASNKPKSKMVARFDIDGQIVSTHFGQRGAEDFTVHKDDNRKANYRARHQHDRIEDPTTACALSWHILWNKTSKRESIADYKKHFGL